MPISGTAACGPTGRCDTGRVPQGNYLWDFRQVPETHLSAAKPAYRSSIDWPD
jgi:hypothetical protein